MVRKYVKKEGKGMKANINLELNKEDLNYELQQLIAVTAQEEITNMVRETAKQLVEEEVKKIIAPIVDSYLKNAIVGHPYEYNSDHIPQCEVNQFIERTLKRYLDEPCYLYSSSSNILSERYKHSSGDRTTRAELWITDKVKEYADKEIYTKVNKIIQDAIAKLTPSEEQLNEIIKKEIAKKINL